MNKIYNFVCLILIFELFQFNLVSSSSQSLDCKCRLGIEKRIVGGQKATKNFIPWIVSLSIADKHFCGAFIINKDFVLTSGSCLLNRKIDEIEIRVGLNKLNDTEKIVHNASELIIEPGYLKNHKTSKIGNLGLIRLKEPIQFIENRVEPACLNLNKTIKSESDVLMVSGFGSVEPTYKNGSKIILVGFPSNDLKYAYFNEDLYCIAQFICIKPVHENDSTCSYDEGSPISRLKLHGRVDVEGLHSHLIGRRDENNKFISNECAGRAIYSRLSSFQSFLEQYIGAIYCKL